MRYKVVDQEHCWYLKPAFKIRHEFGLNMFTPLEVALIIDKEIGKDFDYLSKEKRKATIERLFDVTLEEAEERKYIE